MREWQPIETAPKNELIMLGNSQKKRVTFGLWVHKRKGFFQGVFEIHGSTDWMPLPDPPKEVNGNPD